MKAYRVTIAFHGRVRDLLIRADGYSQGPEQIVFFRGGVPAAWVPSSISISICDDTLATAIARWSPALRGEGLRDSGIEAFRKKLSNHENHESPQQNGPPPERGDRGLCRVPAGGNSHVHVSHPAQPLTATR